MGLHALGDSAWLFKAAGSSAEKKLELILRLRRILELHPVAGIVDIVSSFDTIAVHFQPADGRKILEHLTSLSLDEAGGHPPFSGQTFTIPVAYGGSGLEALADAKNLTVEELIDLHQGAEYTVAAIGFSPGFPYLLGLPAPLHHPRLGSPQKVAAGSVAVAGEQAGIYPFASQGGWHVIGRTDLTLFDPRRDPPALLQPGDRVRFGTAEKLRETDSTPDPETASAGIHVIEPGALSSIQDHGRWGRQHFGVSPGGAADPVLASVANRLVGNPDDAAVIECTMTGPVLRFDSGARVAWVGWADESSGRPHEIKAGGEIDLRRRMRHLRGYLAVAGGIDVPEILGSRATDLRALFGGHHGRTLQADDILPIGKADTSPPLSGRWHVSWPQPEGRLIEIRYLRGMQADWFNTDSSRTFQESFYEISPASDRTGTRLNGARLELKEPREMVSQPVVFGSVQVPPHGQPIVLMSERQTIGGYPQIGHVISADIPRLARAWPGTKVRFRQVELDEARHAWNELQRELGLLSAGLMM